MSRITGGVKTKITQVASVAGYNPNSIDGFELEIRKYIPQIDGEIK